MYQDQTDQLFNIVNKFHKLKSKHKFMELPHREFMMLGTIFNCSMKHQDVGVKISILIELLGGSKSATSKILRGMESKGYIKRIVGTEDRRQVYVILTESGNLILQDSKEKMEKMSKTIMEKMGEEDSKQLITLFQKLFEIVEAEIKEKDRKDEQNA